MSDQVQIDNELKRLSKALAEGSNEYTKLCRETAETRDDYELAKAKAMLKIGKDTKVDLMKAEATLIVEAEMRAAHIAEAQREAVTLPPPKGRGFYLSKGDLCQTILI